MVPQVQRLPLMTTLYWIKILKHMQGLPAHASISTDSPEVCHWPSGWSRRCMGERRQRMSASPRENSVNWEAWGCNFVFWEWFLQRGQENCTALRRGWMGSCIPRLCHVSELETQNSLELWLCFLLLCVSADIILSKLSFNSTHPYISLPMWNCDMLLFWLHWTTRAKCGVISVCLSLLFQKLKNPIP